MFSLCCFTAREAVSPFDSCLLQRRKEGRNEGRKEGRKADTGGFSSGLSSPLVALFHNRQMEVPPRLCRSARVRRCQRYDSPLLSQAQAEKRHKHGHNSPDHRVCAVRRWLQPPTSGYSTSAVASAICDALLSFITMPVALLVAMVPWAHLRARRRRVCFLLGRGSRSGRGKGSESFRCSEESTEERPCFHALRSVSGVSVGEPAYVIPATSLCFSPQDTGDSLDYPQPC